MKNKEKFAKEIMELAKNGAIITVSLKNGHPVSCSAIDCKDCYLFYSGDDCFAERQKWFESESQDEVKEELDTLNSIKENFQYILRDISNELFIFEEEPFWDNNLKRWVLKDESGSIQNISFLKGNFNMIKTTDRKPWLIKDLKEKLKKINDIKITKEMEDIKETK